MKILSTQRTLSGKWQVRIEIDAETSAFFEFKNNPTNDDLEKAYQAYVASREL